MRKVRKGQTYREFGPGHKKFTITGVSGHNAKTSRGTIISVSRLMTTKHYEKIG